MLETVCVCVPRHLMIGKGSITSVVEVLGKIGAIKNPLIVTDKVMVEIGVVARLQKLLAQGGLTSAVYDAVRPDPTDEMVLMGIDILESGCHDAVIGLGGGSPIDAGKAIGHWYRGYSSYCAHSQRDTGKDFMSGRGFCAQCRNY